MAQTELKHLLALVEEVRDAQAKDCRHQHHCHRVADVFEIETIVREMIREEVMRESEAVCRHSARRAHSRLD